MAIGLEDLHVLKAIEETADSIWKRVIKWDDFARDVVGKQITRAVDSIGANIAEAFGRFNYGEKLQFLYYARGSLFETKYWLNRALARELFLPNEHGQYSGKLTNVSRQINAFAESLKTQRADGKKPYKTLREVAADYWPDHPDDFPEILFDKSDLEWLAS